MMTTRTLCRHCSRPIVTDEDGRWIDPEATGDDVIWRETCDEHDTFIADHEPSATHEVIAAALRRAINPDAWPDNRLQDEVRYFIAYLRSAGLEVTPIADNNDDNG